MFCLYHLPREETQLGNALETLASIWEKQEDAMMQPLILVSSSSPRYKMKRILDIEVDDGESCYHDIQTYLKKKRELPEGADKKDQALIKKLASQFISFKENLYKR